MPQNYTPLTVNQDAPIPPLFDGTVDIKPPSHTGRGTLVLLVLGVLSLGAGIGGGYLLVNRGVNLGSMAAVTKSSQSGSPIAQASCKALGPVKNITVTCPNCAASK